MKQLFKFLALLLLVSSTANAQVLEFCREQNVATKIVIPIRDATDGSLVSSAAALDTELELYSDGTAATTFADATNEATELGSTGIYSLALTAGEVNDSYIIGQTKTTTTDAMTTVWGIRTNCNEVTIATGGIGPLASAFDGDTLGEGTATLDLEANEISADNQFQNDRLLLFDSNGKYYASACIVSSTDTNERVTLDKDVSSLHTTGDSYLIRSDAACAISSNPALLVSTTIASLASQTSFTLTEGSTDDDAYNDAIIVITDASTSSQKAVGTISDYVGSTKTVTLSADPAVFTMATSDTVDIIAATGGSGGGGFSCATYFGCSYPASPTANTLGEGVQVAPRRD